MDYKIYLKSQKPIKFYDVCKIYQPSFDDILEIGIPEFEQLLVPFIITVDSLSTELSEDEKEKIKSLDIIASSPEIVNSLFTSLEFFCRSKVLFDKDGLFFEGFDGRLNRDNFDEFAEIILEINARERPKKEHIPVFKNETQRDIWTKIQEGRKRYAQRNVLKLEDILNYCEFGGNSYIPIDEILKWSLWRIMNCYKSIMGISSYKDSFSIYLISGEKSLIEGKHWTELIKIDYKQNEY